MFAIKFWLTLNLAFFHLSQLLLFHVSRGSCKHDFPSGSRYKAKAIKESVGIQASCFWWLALRSILELKRKVISLLEFSYLSFTFWLHLWRALKLGLDGDLMEFHEAVLSDDCKGCSYFCWHSLVDFHRASEEVRSVDPYLWAQELSPHLCFKRLNLL